MSKNDPLLGDFLDAWPGCALIVAAFAVLLLIAIVISPGGCK